MAKANGQFGILEAVPGARSSLRWLGWCGLALLVIPAVVLAVLVETDDTITQDGGVGLLLPAAGVLALVAAGWMLVSMLGSLRRLAELAQLLCEHTDGPVFVKDSTHRYRFVNEAAATLLGRRPQDVVGHRDSDLQPGAESLAFEENDRVCLDRDLPTMFRESQTTGGGERSFLVSKRPLHNARGKITGLVGAARDITDESSCRN